MSRIRSVHPGLATDESYMALSHVAARVLPHLWCECDDQGVFEWKPLTLKARILPAHNDSMDDILAELERLNFVTRFTSNGKSYGAVRNFRRYQRPKKPKSVYPMPDEFRNYVGLTADSSEPPQDDSDEIPPNSEKPPQMEDGGGRREDGGKNLDAAAGGRKKLAFTGKIVRLTEPDLAKWRKSFSAIPDLCAELTSLDAYYDNTLQGAERKNWFVRCSAALAKKQQEWAAKVEAQKQPSSPGRAWA